MKLSKQFTRILCLPNPIESGLFIRLGYVFTFKQTQFDSSEYIFTWVRFDIDPEIYLVYLYDLYIIFTYSKRANEFFSC